MVGLVGRPALVLVEASGRCGVGIVILVCFLLFLAWKLYVNEVQSVTSGFKATLYTGKALRWQCKCYAMHFRWFKNLGSNHNALKWYAKVPDLTKLWPWCPIEWGPGCRGLRPLSWLRRLGPFGEESIGLRIQSHLDVFEFWTHVNISLVQVLLLRMRKLQNVLHILDV